MRLRGVRRFIGDWRFIGLLLVVFSLAVVLAWWLLLRPWPFVTSHDSFEGRLAAGNEAMVDYRDRLEARMRLQFLEAELDDGRRSGALRPGYRLLEELLEPLIARAPPAERAKLQNELGGLLPDLVRDRRAARERIQSLDDLLTSPAGPGRQGGEQ